MEQCPRALAQDYFLLHYIHVAVTDGNDDDDDGDDDDDHRHHHHHE